MTERLEELAHRKEAALHAGSAARRRAPALQGQDDRPGTDRLPPRRRHLSGARHAGPHPGPRPRRRQAPVHRRRHHRLRDRRGPPGLHLQPGLHRQRRIARGGLRREGAQDHGPGHLARRTHHRDQRRWRGAGPGRRGRPALLRRDLQAKCRRVRRRAPDQRDPRLLRRRGGLQPGDDRLHLHGARDVADVHHRARRRQDRHGRGGDPRTTRRRGDPRHQVRAWPPS